MAQASCTVSGPHNIGFTETVILEDIGGALVCTETRTPTHALPVKFLIKTDGDGRGVQFTTTGLVPNDLVVSLSGPGLCVPAFGGVSCRFLVDHASTVTFSHSALAAFGTLSFTHQPGTGFDAIGTITTIAGISAPEMDVSGNGQAVSHNSQPTVANGTDFGSVETAGASNANSFAIANSGPGDLTLSGNPIVSISGANASDFTVTAQPASGTITAGGGPLTFTIAFDPSGIGNRSATASIANNDSNESPYSFTIKGRGTDTVGPAVVILNAPANWTPATSFNVTLQFSEPIGSQGFGFFPNFPIGGITVGNGAASNLIRVDDQTYTVDITPDETGAVTIDVRAGVKEDANRNPNTAAQQVVVGEPNEPPVIVTSGGGDTAAISMSENQTLVTFVHATDADGDQATFSITGGADQAAFEIVPGEDIRLLFKTAPDFENPTDNGTNNTYVVEITASDGKGGTDSQIITVTVVNANEVPVITSDGGGNTALLTVGENQTAVTTVTATDPDGDALTFAFDLDEGDSDKFAIDANSGVLTFIAAPDFENPADSDANNTYVARIVVTDGKGGFDTQRIVVTVTNVNEALFISSDGGGDTAAVFVAEDQTAVTTVAATDADGDAPIFSLTGGADQGKFSIDANSGALTFQTAPNFETPTDADNNNTYLVEITASDGKGNVDTQTITVTVTNLNETLAITSDGGGDVAAISVAENQTAVTTVVAVDPDGDTPVFSLTGGADQGRFSIDAASGVLTLISAPDFENPADSDANNTYVVEITASDGMRGTDMQTITVTVTNLAEDTSPPTVVIEAPASSSGPFTATFTFSEPVNGFALADITGNNCTVSAFTGSDGDSVYTAFITPIKHGDVTLDVAAGMAQDLAGNGNIAAPQMTVSFIDHDFVRTRTQRAISNFMSRRADQITLGAPNLSARLNRGTGAGGAPVGFTASGTLRNNRIAFSTSLRQMLGSDEQKRIKLRTELGHMMELGQQSVINDLGTGFEENGLDIWVQGTWAKVKSDTRESDVGLLYLGAEYRFHEDLLIGLLTQFDWIDEQDTTQNTSGEGNGWMAGPYVVARLHDNLIFDGRVAWGQSDNSVSPFGTFSDSFDGERWLVQGQFTGDFNFARWSFAPHAGIIYFGEDQKAYTDSLGVFIPSQTVSLGRLTFGPSVSTSFLTPDGTAITPHVGVTGIWDFKKTQTVDLTTGLAADAADDVRARFEGGVSVRMPNGWSLDSESFYDGIGADNFEAYGVSVRLKVPLN